MHAFLRKGFFSLRPLLTLKDRRDFRRLTTQGQKWVAGSFILQAANLSQEPDKEVHPRMGYTVSKKVGKAVIRNKVKRRLREAVRLVFSEKKYPTTDYVLIARTGVHTKKFDQLVGELRWALGHLDRLLTQG